MSIAVILNILSFIKKNWGAFLVIALATALFISTFYFRFYITRIENKLEDVIEENQQLIASNIMFKDEVAKKQLDIERLYVFSNSYTSLLKSTNFKVPKETTKVMLDINFDFYSNRYKNNNAAGTNELNSILDASTNIMREEGTNERAEGVNE